MKIIPVFIPHAGCPYKCVYCDQHKISGATRMPSTEEIHSMIRRNLETVPKDAEVEVGFFGGTFTFLPEELQEKYLDAVYPYVKSRAIKSIRMSTHPEAVSPEAMRRFKGKGGSLVELGIQSLDRGVLRKIKRETSLGVIKKTAGCIKKAGLELGVQVMLGLPGDTIEKSIRTAKELIRLRPKTARIYPTLVIRGTELAEMYKKRKYRPLSLVDAIGQAARIADVFEDAGIRVIRIGLHPSRDLDSKSTMLAGPYHPAFGEMVRSRQMRNKIINSIKDKHVPNRWRIEIHAPRRMFNLVSGHKSAEKKFLESYFRARIALIEAKSRLKVRDIRKGIAIIDPRMPVEAKERLKRLNYHIAEAPLHKRLPGPVRGHVDMMLFSSDKHRVIYEPQIEYIAGLLRQNGYNCIKGEEIKSCRYPGDIIYNACRIGKHVIHYKGEVEKHIKTLRLKHIRVTQGYAKCSIVPVDERHIITSDESIKEAWEKRGGIALFVRPGYVRLPGYKSGFIGGATGVTDRYVLFVGSLDTHPDSLAIRNFIKKAGKGIIELCDGLLYDVGSIVILPCLSINRVLY